MVKDRINRTQVCLNQTQDRLKKQTQAMLEAADSNLIKAYCT